MKIAIFTDVFLDISGGIVTSIRSQKNQLEKMGHTVYLFTPAFHNTIMTFPNWKIKKIMSYKYNYFPERESV